ncbi:MAG TPA: prephenate dehydrogenase [Bacteroidetes bacterium]|nr:prephenate dehydrogenase [Bacteroidota bacterium]
MTITIIGIGLIGGSMAITLKENGFADKIIGVDQHQESLDKALRRRIIDEDMPLREGVENADLIILATPVDAMLQLLPQILDMLTDQVLIEVGSTKERILEKVKDHPKRKNYVATHPMAGTEYSGIEAAIPNLFDGKFTVICDGQDSDPAAVELVEKMYRSMNMEIARIDAKNHDVHAAYVSHISHISSFALALTVLEKEQDEKQIFELASSGFASTVRLAKSSPDMWTPIFRQNRDNLLDVLDEHINVLSQFRSFLIKNNFDGIHQAMEKANRIGEILDK